MRFGGGRHPLKRHRRVAMDTTPCMFTHHEAHSRGLFSAGKVCLAAVMCTHLKKCMSYARSVHT
jgi:ectoine hydroxylase-related dioxygenase (phytanoyl-CoA dioxygenase family)